MVSSSPRTNQRTSGSPRRKDSERIREIRSPEGWPVGLVYRKREMSSETMMAGKESSPSSGLTRSSNQTCPRMSFGRHHSLTNSFRLFQRCDEPAMPKTMCLRDNSSPAEGRLAFLGNGRRETEGGGATSRGAGEHQRQPSGGGEEKCQDGDHGRACAAMTPMAASNSTGKNEKKLKIIYHSNYRSFVNVHM
ncbi:unnamed protein product, partial [Vitis vinifera]